MNWWNILKNAKISGKAKGKGSSFDASKIKINVDNRDDCNMKLQEWANKLKNYDLLMKKRFEKNKLLQKHFEIVKDKTQPQFKKFILHQKGEQEASHLRENTYFYYNPVPEEVACKAIDMLEKLSNREGEQTDSLEIDGIKYSWSIKMKRDRVDNRAELIILVGGVIKVLLSWENGVDTSYGTDEYRRDLKGNQEDNNVYHLSGYYGGTKFGRSWWK